MILCRVLKALTRKFQLHEDVSLYAIAKRCPPNFSGADMYALCADAWFQAAKRQVLKVPVLHKDTYRKLMMCLHVFVIYIVGLELCIRFIQQ